MVFACSRRSPCAGRYRIRSAPRRAAPGILAMAIHGISSTRCALPTAVPCFREVSVTSIGVASPVRVTSSIAPSDWSGSFSCWALRSAPPTTPSCERWSMAQSCRWKAGSHRSSLPGSAIATAPTSHGTPDRFRCLGHELQLGALVCFRHRVAGNGRGKAALRADRELIERDILRGFAHAALQHLACFECRKLAADETQHHALVLDEAQRLEIAGALGVVFEQEMRDPGAAEESFGNRFITARAEIMAPEIAAAHVNADHDARWRRRHRMVDALDIEIDQRIRF